MGSPEAVEFYALLEVLQSGRTPDNGRSKKTQVMKWCLEEALLEFQRQALGQAKTITICRDERAQRLLIRYSSCDSALRVDRGMLGMAKNFGTGADQITQATASVLSRFCTKCHGCPNQNIEPKLDEDLLQHIKSHIEVVVVDAAADELLSSNIGRGRRSAAVELSDAKLTPNLILVARDRAHASRRRAESSKSQAPLHRTRRKFKDSCCLNLPCQDHQAPL